jgi:hypothetical protein
MASRLHPLIFILLAGFILVSARPARAQNVNQFQEEEIKDKEREVKKKQYEDERKAQEAKALSQPMTEEELANTNLVEVEPVNILPSDITNVYRVLPYKVRRPKWGHQFAIGMSLYQPVNYQTAYASAGTGSYSSYYAIGTPLIELCYTYRYNSAIGGLGLDFAFGYFQANSNATLNATLSVQPARIGAKWILDNITSEPYVVPFAFGGIYEAIYSEAQGAVTFSGNTQPALYYGAGLMFQLNWLDPDGAVASYNDSGVENTFLYLEARQYTASSSAADPNFSSNVVIGGGLNMEF